MTDILTKTYESIQDMAKASSFILSHTPKGRFDAAGLHDDSFQLFQQAVRSPKIEPDGFNSEIHASRALAMDTVSSLHSLLERRLIEVIPEVDKSDSESLLYDVFEETVRNFIHSRGVTNGGVIVIICDHEFIRDINPSREIPDDLKEMWKSSGFDSQCLHHYFMVDGVYVVPVVNSMTPRYNSDNEREEFYKKVPASSGEGYCSVVNNEYLSASTGSFLIWSLDIIVWCCLDENSRYGQLEMREDYIYNLMQAAILVVNPNSGRFVKYKRNLNAPPQPKEKL